ncbi:MAG: hypothetical protein ACTSR0_01490 [Candidatus Asgardarchaeia archaeon]
MRIPALTKKQKYIITGIKEKEEELKEKIKEINGVIDVKTDPVMNQITIIYDPTVHGILKDVEKEIKEIGCEILYKSF